jgi:hypothetical protein
MVVLVGAGLVLAFALSACGGSDPTSSEGVSSSAEPHGYVVRASTTVETASPRLDKQQFVALTNKICRERWKVVQQNFIEYMSWRKPPQTKQERFVETVRVSLLAGVDFHIFDQIQHEGAAQGQSPQVEKILGALQKPVELGQHEYWEAQTMSEISPHFGDYNRLAKQYGLDDCPVDRANLQPIAIAVHREGL